MMMRRAAAIACLGLVLMWGGGAKGGREMVWHVGPAGNHDFMSVHAAAEALVQKEEDLANVTHLRIVIHDGHLDRPLQLNARHSLPDGTVTWTGAQAGQRLTTALPVHGFTRKSSTPDGSSLWSTVVPDHANAFTDVYWQGQALTRARTPNLGQFFVWDRPLCPDVRTNATCAKEARFGFYYAHNDVQEAWRNESNAQFMVYHGWTASRHHLRIIDPSAQRVLFTNPSDRPIGYWPNVDSEGGGRYFVENIRSGLDANFEWYFDSTTRELSLLLPETLNLTDGDIWIPQTDNLLFVNGTHNHDFSGIDFTYTNWVCGPTTVCDKQSASWQRQAAIDLFDVVNVTFSNNEIVGAGACAVWVHGSSVNITVDRNVLRDLGTGALRVGDETPEDGVPYRVTLQNNIIHRGGLSFPSGTPILIQKAINVSVVHNEVSYFSYAGISVGWSWNFEDPSSTANVTVAYNHVHDLGTGTFRQLGDAMAAVYTLGVLHGTEVHHNLLHDVYAWYTGGFCLSQDQGSSDISFHDNVCHGTTGASQTQHYGVNNTWVVGTTSTSQPASQPASQPCRSFDICFFYDLHL
ncbi:uncharacterized protein MONBRDRAFT_36322 [Monosiga brevicollis MX1]|uniref:Right handed beta helix domain-containing protein n=1 Tax=Monosiga brevicollis TaxID=81824 RepID=A9UUX2_MONBE|nr:uncharacterized protein MONBRDRAFT_36322 [Monosiga brevicollis MX1]EDQ90793.1 predicted protein [Monosiga brevicollis MX1]|eukprot:XP_001744090.1 hypothetical protein [Monosiga brevicollis MX1]